MFYEDEEIFMIHVCKGRNVLLFVVNFLRFFLNKIV